MSFLLPLTSCLVNLFPLFILNGNDSLAILAVKESLLLLLPSLPLQILILIFLKINYGKILDSALWFPAKTYNLRIPAFSFLNSVLSIFGAILDKSSFPKNIFIPSIYCLFTSFSTSTVSNFNCPEAI